MIRHRLVYACTAVTVAVTVAAGQTPTSTDRTVRDGIYTAEQAKRGRTAYDTKCASCHDGGTMGPELWGDAFLASWDSKDLNALFNRIQTTMPEDAPGSLSESAALDIIAYVVQTNGFPPGDKAIQSAGALPLIRIVRKP